MSIKQIQIKVQDLTLGMYVSGLDRPWSQTPFPLQGFHVRTPADVETLKSYCSYVYIDVTKGKAPLNIADAKVRVPDQKPAINMPSISREKVRFTAPKDRNIASFIPTPIVIRRDVYKTTVPMRVEAAKAQKIIRELKGSLAVASKMIAKGRDVDLKSLRASVDDMVGSVLRCPDAFTWLLRLRHKDQHSHDHSLRSAMWAVQFARYAGMAKDEITILCLGTLLKDVGKVKISNQILRKTDRTAEEQEEYQRFVEYGVEMLRASRTIEPRVISVVRYHCENYNGTGFPEGIMGSKIPLLARIAGIATTYDAISNPREIAEPVAPSRAVSLLYNMRDTRFQDDLVVNFIRSIGLYPTGTMVELTTGDIGVVLEQHPESRLTPQVAVLDRLSGDLNNNCIIIDLKDELEARKRLMDSGRDNVMNVDKIAIARDLEPTGYDIDLANISSLFLSAAGLDDTPSASGGILGGIRQRLFKTQS